MSDAIEAPVANVLVVDDDGVVRALARTLLEKSGFHVSEASDGSEALGHLDTGCRCDLMILDLNMPGIGGYEVLRTVRSSGTGADLPIVVLAGADDVAVENTLRAEGATEFIRKPIDPTRFAGRIKDVLEQSRA